MARCCGGGQTSPPKLGSRSNRSVTTSSLLQLTFGANQDLEQVHGVILTLEYPSRRRWRNDVATLRQ